MIMAHPCGKDHQVFNAFFKPAAGPGYSPLRFAPAVPAPCGPVPIPCASVLSFER